MSAVAVVLAFAVHRPASAAAKAGKPVTDMLDGLVIHRLEGETGLDLTAWAYACAGQPSCADGCADTLKELGAGHFNPTDGPAFCPAFRKEAAIAPAADTRAKTAAALAWIRKRVQAAAVAERRGADANDRDRIDCRLAQLQLGGDAKTCPRADALMAAATLSRMAKDPAAEQPDVLWAAFCSEIESCAGGCAAMLTALPRIAPEGASRLPLCADAQTALRNEKVGFESVTRFGRQRAAAFVTRAAAALDPARGKAMRCDAARLHLIPAEIACAP